MKLLKSMVIVHPLPPAPFPSPPIHVILWNCSSFHLCRFKSQGQRGLSGHVCPERCSVIQKLWRSAEWASPGSAVETQMCPFGWKHPILIWWLQEMEIHLFSFTWLLLLVLFNTLAEVCAFNSLSFPLVFSLPWTHLFFHLCYQITYLTGRSDDTTKMARLGVCWGYDFQHHIIG